MKCNFPTERIMMYTVRIVLAVILALFASLIWYSALTVPAVAATSYLILALVISTATYFVSPFRFRKAKTK